MYLFFKRHSAYKKYISKLKKTGIETIFQISISWLKKTGRTKVKILTANKGKNRKRDLKGWAWTTIARDYIALSTNPKN